MQGMHVRLDINLRVPIPKMDLDDDDEDDEGDGDRLILTHWLKQNKIVLSLSCMVSLFSQSNRTHSKFDCQSSIYKTPSVALYMELEFFFSNEFVPFPLYRMGSRNVDREERREALARQETKPTSHQERAGFFLVQTQGKRIEQHGRRDTEAHNILAHVTSN